MESKRENMPDHSLISVQKIGELSPDGIIIYQLTTNTFEYANTSFKKIFDLHGPVLETKALFDQIITEDIQYTRSRLSDLLARHVVNNVWFRISCKNIVKHLSCDAYMLKEENKVLAIVKDITEAKEHEDYIIKYGGKKNTLLEMLSHNLSGPLSLSQRVIASLEKSFKKEKPANLTTHINFIKNSTQHCIDIIHDFLKEEHMVSEHIYVKRNRFDVVEKINAILDQFNYSYPNRKLRLQTICNQVFINGDDVKFLQILNNLISNAVKFTPSNCYIEISLLENPHNVTIIVADDGIGIPEHLKPLVFQKFTPAGRTGLNGEKSIGVGLSIVKRLVELMKGEITFESKEGKGTTFYLTLPKE